MEQEKIQELKLEAVQVEGELAGLLGKASEIRAQVVEEEKERARLAELTGIEMEIKSKRDRSERIRLQLMNIRREGVLREAEGLAEEKKKLLARINEIDRRGNELLVEFDSNIPRRRVQTLSSQFLKVERWVPSLGEFNFDITGKSFMSTTKKREEMVTTLLNLKACLAAGWTLVSGQSIPEPEKLTDENSREFPTETVPDLFVDFVPIQPYPVFIPARR